MTAVTHVCMCDHLLPVYFRFTVAERWARLRLRVCVCVFVFVCVRACVRVCWRETESVFSVLFWLLHGDYFDVLLTEYIRCPYNMCFLVFREPECCFCPEEVEWNMIVCTSECGRLSICDTLRSGSTAVRAACLVGEPAAT